MEGVDLNRLGALLASIGWTQAQMERAIGKPITQHISAEDKRLIWAIIRDWEARRWLTLVRAYFPDAIITAIERVE